MNLKIPKPKNDSKFVKHGWTNKNIQNSDLMKHYFKGSIFCNNTVK